MTSITPFLWFDNNVPEAVAFYKSVFPNAKVETVNDFMATFELEGQKFNGIHVGHVAVLLLRQARPSLLPTGRSTKDLRASRPGRRED